MTDDLTRYLRENRERYTREALTEHLIAEGHDPGAIEAAWARLDAESAWAPRPSGGAGAARTLPAIIVALLYSFAIAAGVLGAVLAAGSGEPASTVILAVYAVAMTIAMVFTFRRMTRAPAEGGGAAGFLAAFAIAVVAFVGLSGLCVAGLNVAVSLVP